MSIPEYFELEGGDRMPRIGFGTWQVSLKKIRLCATLIFCCLFILQSQIFRQCYETVALANSSDSSPP